MIKVLVLIVVINFNSLHQTIELSPLKEEFKYQLNHEKEQSPFGEKIEREILSSVSGSVHLVNEPTRQILQEVDHYSVNEYHVTSTYFDNGGW